MSNIIQITDHAAAAKIRLLFQYQGKANIEALLDSLGSEQIQDLEDVLFGFYSRLNVGDSVGVQLDEIGEIVGQPRKGLDDATYRVFINAKIGRNVSEGDIERIISIWSIIAGASTTQIIENYPAEIELYSDSPLSDELAAIALPLMQDAVAAGVRVVSSVIFTSPAFGFDGSVDTLGYEGLLSTGANTSTSAFKLIDSGKDFVAAGVVPGNEAIEIAGNQTAIVQSVDSPIQLTLDIDAFQSFPLDYDVTMGVGGKLAHVQVA